MLSLFPSVYCSLFPPLSDSLSFFLSGSFAPKDCDVINYLLSVKCVIFPVGNKLCDSYHGH